MNRLLNKLFEDETFLVDQESIPYIVRDIINMNWWNTCGFLGGYKNNRRVYLDVTKEMKLTGLILKEYYRHTKVGQRDVVKLEKELKGYIESETKALSQLKLFSLEHRRNDSQYFHKDSKPTWLDCTSRAKYAWMYVGQNGHVDFDGVCRLTDGEKVIDFCTNHTVYPDRDEVLSLFAAGSNKAKEEIRAQKTTQNTVEEWVERLGINVIESRKQLYNKIAHVKTDPNKNNEKALLKQGRLVGNNELLYGFKTFSSIDTGSASRASSASGASRASGASDPSRASGASNASRASDASYASHASNESNASRASQASHASDPSHASNWFESDNSIGALPGLEHPPVFMTGKYALAGHWKINKDLVDQCKVGWFDPFMGHGESPLYACKTSKNYVGIEINADSMNGYMLPHVQRVINEYTNSKVDMRLGDSAIFCSDLENKFDLCYTSPPYFQFEEYGYHNKVVFDCFDYDEYHERVTKPIFSNVYKYLIPGGTLAIQTEKNKKLKDKWKNALLSLGFVCIEDTITGQEDIKYSLLSKRDQSLLIFKKPL